MITTLLWDVDGTLLDFKAAESAAVRTLFQEFSLGPCTDEMIRRYSKINEKYWQRLERNEITKPETLVGRFREFFTEMGIDPELAVPFNDRYQVRLGDTAVPQDDSLNLVKSLKNTVRQYAVSNGTVYAQSKKLEKSGLDEYLDGIFLSEELGAEKPNTAFFDKVFAAIPEKNRNNILIIGDSLTSDIRGGMNAGILTCWYNPENSPRPEEYKINHMISDLREIQKILEEEK